MGGLGQCGRVDIPETGEGACPDPATQIRHRGEWQVVFCDVHAAVHDVGGGDP